MKRTQEKIAQAVQSYLETGDASVLAALPANIENRIKRYRNASLWLWLANSSIGGVEVSGAALKIKPELRILLLPVAALIDFGTVDEITANIETVKKTIEIVSNKSIVPALEEEVALLEKTKSDMAIAEKVLATMGWKFNTKKRKASRKEDHKGKDLLTECVWTIYAEKYRDEYPGASPGKKRAIRTKIAATLAPWFDDENLSAEPDAPFIGRSTRVKHAAERLFPKGLLIADDQKKNLLQPA